MPINVGHPITAPAPNNPVIVNSTDALVPGVSGSAVTTFVKSIDPEGGGAGMVPSLPTSPNGLGVFGLGHTGVQGQSDTGDGVYGLSETGRGVHGQSKTFQGVYGQSDSQAGVVGESNTFDGIFGMSHSPNAAGISGHNDKGGMGGFFDAKVVVNSDANVSGTLAVGNISLGGNLTIASGGDLILSDCAECFEVSGPGAIEPGTVMAIDEQGGLRPSGRGYDKRVAGVVSGAGNYRPAIVLGAEERSGSGVVVALFGKAYCKVDAGLAPIEVGDLLTSSDTPGHAMKAADQNRAFGAVIGKALRPLDKGTGLIPILIALQ